MSLVQDLIEFFKQSEDKTKDRTPEGLCPVCWGYQEYDHKIRKIYKDRQIDVNNHQASYMLMEDFVVNHIDGIKLKEAEVDSCPTCSSGEQDYNNQNESQ